MLNTYAFARAVAPKERLEPRPKPLRQPRKRQASSTTHQPSAKPRIRRPDHSRDGVDQVLFLVRTPGGLHPRSGRIVTDSLFRVSHATGRFCAFYGNSITAPSSGIDSCSWTGCGVHTAEGDNTTSSPAVPSFVKRAKRNGRPSDSSKAALLLR